MTPLGLIYVAIMFVYVRLFRGLIQRVFENSLQLNPTVRAFRRSTLLAILFGVGGIWVEGFGLPVPFLLAMLMILAGLILEGYSALSYLLAPNLIGFAVSWLLLFTGFMLREHYLDLLSARLRRKRFDLQPWPKWTLIALLSVAVAMAVPLFVSSQRTAKRLEIRKSLLPSVEKIQRSTEHVWQREGRLLCQDDDRLAPPAETADTELIVEARTEGCGNFVLSAISSRGVVLGDVVLKAEPTEGLSGMTLEWECRGATYFKFEEPFVFKCPSSRRAIYSPIDEPLPPIMKASAYDFLAVEGDGWQGTRRVYDSNNKLISKIDIDVSIDIPSADEVEILYSYPDAPHMDSRSRIKFSRDGTVLDGAEVIDHSYTDAGVLRIITFSDSTGDSQSSKVRKTYLIAENSFVQRIVTAEKGSEAVRTEYVLDRS